MQHNFYQSQAVLKNDANDETQGTVTVANRTGKLEALAVLTKREGHEMENYADSAERQAITGSGRPVADPQDNSSHNVLTKLKYQLTETQDIGLTAELFKTVTGIVATHIPYKGCCASVARCDGRTG